MVMYKGVVCKKCNRFSMSTAEKHPKCAYCGSVSVNVRMEHENSRVVSEYVRRANAGHLYDDKVVTDAFR